MTTTPLRTRLMTLFAEATATVRRLQASVAPKTNGFRQDEIIAIAATDSGVALRALDDFLATARQYRPALECLARVTAELNVTESGKRFVARRFKEDPEMPERLQQAYAVVCDLLDADVQAPAPAEAVADQ